MKNDIVNILYALLFAIVSLLTWCAIAFKIADCIWGEEVLFSSKRNAILTYSASIFIALVMTGVIYYLIYLFQRL